MGRHGSDRNTRQTDLIPRTRRVVLKQSGKLAGTFPGSLELTSRSQFHKNLDVGHGMKRVAMAAFELKLSQNGFGGRGASFESTPRILGVQV